jgi:hypothetical protein
MDFKLGEFVRFVDEKREGYITKIFDDNTVGVTGDDDFEIPTTQKNLTRVHGHSNYIETKKELLPTILSPEVFKETGIYLAISPDFNKGSVVHFYILNDTSNQLLCCLNTHKNGVTRGEFAELIPPMAAKKVYVASLPELDNWPEFIFRTIAYTTTNNPISNPIRIKKIFKAKDFSGATQKNNLLPQPAWVIKLDEAEIKIDAQKLKESFFSTKTEIPTVQKPANTVDLHIEKLNLDYTNLSNVEIIEAQLNYFNKTIDAAVIHKLSSIIFIHGVGNGTLKSLLHKQLGKNPQVKTFMDAYKEKFGYGATQVFFK